MTSVELLKTMLIRAKETGATDLHLTAAAKPMIRTTGGILPLDGFPALKPEEIKETLFGLLNERQREELSKFGDLDTAFGIRGLGRFRVNIYKQRGSYAAAIRLMYPVVPTVEAAGIPEGVRSIASQKSGLILASGLKGSGKSTAIAALLQEINRTRNCHILTIEDPIEYLFRHDKSIVDQREVGLDCMSFASGIHAAVRQDPDVIFVGEIRDRETLESVLFAAETGHLVFSTIHVQSPELIGKRILHMFEDSEKEKVKEQLTAVLSHVIVPNLLRNVQGKITANYELYNKSDLEKLL